MPERSDHYRTIGVRADATTEEIREAHRNLARRFHPDLMNEPGERLRFEGRMAEINEAWTVLSNPERRAQYDRERGNEWQRRPMSKPSSSQFGKSDAFQNVEVSNASGCALRIGPVLLLGGILIAILVITALATGGGESQRRFDVGDCVQINDYGLKLVGCNSEAFKIVDRGVVGMSCPDRSVAKVLPIHTERICVSPVVD